LTPDGRSGMVEFMTRWQHPGIRWNGRLWLLLTVTSAAACLAETPTPEALKAFDAYIRGVESSLDQQHRSEAAFLVPQALNSGADERMRRGELIIERIAPSAAPVLPGAMLHHWRGTAFVAGATAADFEQLMRDFNAYPLRFSPQVVKAKVLTQRDDHYLATLRVRQQHVITVVLDTTCDVVFGRLDARRGYSISRSTKVSEIDSPGTAKERALDSKAQHGFLWRLNTYWSYEERDGGLYMQIESVSLTRSIPNGLGWAIGPFIESIPRESLEFTLRSTCNALRKK